MTTTVPRAALAGLETPALIEQYETATGGRHSGVQNGPAGIARRIGYIVELLSDRADHDDPAALAWYGQA